MPGKVELTGIDVEVILLYYKARDYFIRKRFMLGIPSKFYARLLGFPKMKGGRGGVNKKFSTWIRTYYLPLQELFDRVVEVHGRASLNYLISRDERFAELRSSKKIILTEYDKEYLEKRYKRKEEE